MTFRRRENNKKIDFLLIRKEHQRFLRHVKAIRGKFQHVLVVADRDERKTVNVVRKTCIERRQISLLKDKKIRKQHGKCN